MHPVLAKLESSYSNHFMALLIEIVDYPLHQLEEVPEEMVGTDRSRRWGIRGEKVFPKEAIISCTVQKHLISRGIQPTVYNPRIGHNNCLNPDKIKKLQEGLHKINPGIYLHILFHHFKKDYIK